MEQILLNTEKHNLTRRQDSSRASWSLDHLKYVKSSSFGVKRIICSNTVKRSNIFWRTYLSTRINTINWEQHSYTNILNQTYQPGGGGGGGGSVMHGTKKRQKTDDLYHICIYDFPINVIFIIYILHKFCLVKTSPVASVVFVI